MSRRLCEHEPDILTAAVAGRQQPAGALAHLASCPSCRDAVATAAWMQRMADGSGDGHALPDPAVIWWKAQLLRRWEAERRAVAPIERMHWVELVAGLASFGVFLVWQWSGLVNVLSLLNPLSLAARSASASSATSPLVLVLVLGGTLALGGMIFAGLHRRITQH
ncbi:MAG: hypothetical protein NTY02_03800 [Acidobacteria bacterium]|nr:hypothetical protein [Acidobacteriota bacterium]